MDTLPDDILWEINLYTPSIDLSYINNIFRKIIYPKKFRSMNIDMFKVDDDNYEEFIHFLQKHPLINKFSKVRSIDQLINLKKYMKCITHLDFAYEFNEKIEKGVLPESLTYLSFGFYKKLQNGCNIYTFQLNPISYKPSGYVVPIHHCKSKIRIQ